ncbi:hypothetical protein ACFQT0_10670 [Hymenobacter humi]|uniref:Uncharacterized protein n=1 Tax=Hymenobacter humi TaxID=1411620 RepID=A0ABW2U4I1_9BACT
MQLLSFSSLGWLTFGNDVMTAMVLMALYLGGWVYLPVALAATALVYRHWLFRPNVKSIATTNGLS